MPRGRGRKRAAASSSLRPQAPKRPRGRPPRKASLNSPTPLTHEPGHTPTNNSPVSPSPTTRTTRRRRAPNPKYAPVTARGPPPPDASEPASPPSAQAGSSPAHEGDPSNAAPSSPPLRASPPPPPDRTHGMSYFEAHRGTVRTSNHTLASLNLVPPAALDAALREAENPLQDHQERLFDGLKAQFPRFDYLLKVGHSLLLYGYGSKRRVLEDFAEFCAEESTVLVLNGFNPTISLRAVLNQISSDILHLGAHPKRSLLDYVDAIRSGIGSTQLTLVLHNIDSPALRSTDAQHALAALSAVSGISLAASADHINTPLLWDGVTYARYRWVWIRAHTFEPYAAETVFMSKPLLRGGAERQVEGAVALLRSLSIKARSVFKELARRQTGGAVLVEDGVGGEGVRTTFNELFVAAKELFLVADTASLQSILTELETHELLECRRGADAASQLHIPLQLEQMKMILKEIGDGH